MKNNILIANCLVFLIGCDLPNVENSSAKLIEGEVIMEDFDSNNLLNWKIVNAIERWSIDSRICSH